MWCQFIQEKILVKVFVHIVYYYYYIIISIQLQTSRKMSREILHTF